VVQWKEKSPLRGRPEFDRFYLVWGSNKKQRSWDGRGARSVPVGVAMSQRARTRGQNPLVQNIRRKQRSGQHTLAYQNNILKNIRTCSSVVWIAFYFVISVGILFWEQPTKIGLCNLQESHLYATISKAFAVCIARLEYIPVLWPGWYQTPLEAEAYAF
jgi:hypothetical protein